MRVPKYSAKTDFSTNTLTNFARHFSSEMKTSDIFLLIIFFSSDVSFLFGFVFMRTRVIIIIVHLYVISLYVRMTRDMQLMYWTHENTVSLCVCLYARAPLLIVWSSVYALFFIGVVVVVVIIRERKFVFIAFHLLDVQLKRKERCVFVCARKFFVLFCVVFFFSFIFLLLVFKPLFLLLLNPFLSFAHSPFGDQPSPFMFNVH